jgi:hypothetical protein
MVPVAFANSSRADTDADEECGVGVEVDEELELDDLIDATVFVNTSEEKYIVVVEAQQK